MELSEFIEEFESEQQVKIISKGTVLYEGKSGTLDTLLHATLVKHGTKLENDNMIIEVVKW